MSSAIEADRARIAIMLSLLKFKPIDQSYASYTFDLLFIIFPSSNTSLAPQGESVWRERSLALERNIRELQTRYDDHIKFLTLTRTVTARTLSPGPAPGLTRKKKVKKVPMQKETPIDAVSSRGDLDGILNGIRETPGIKTLTGSDSIFTALDSLRRLLVTGEAQQGIPIDLLLSASARIMTGIHTLLQSVISSQFTHPSSARVLLMVANVIPDVLNAVFPFLVRREPQLSQHTSPESTYIDEVLRLLSIKICIPVIRTIAPQSLSRASSIFLEIGGKEMRVAEATSVDILNNSLYVLRRTMAALSDVAVLTGPNVIESVKEVLALEVLRELEKLYTDPLDDKGALPPGFSLSSETRVNNLAAKDTLSYLVNVLHLLFTPRSPHAWTLMPVIDGKKSTVVKDNILKDALLTSLLRVIRHYSGSSTFGGKDCDKVTQGFLPRPWDRKGNFGEVGCGVLFAVVEQAWQCSWV